MKIISPPKLFKGLNHNCVNCEAHLFIEEEDVKCQYYAGDMREPSETSFWAKCPCCGVSIPIRGEDLTALLRNRLVAEAK